jgi:alpha-aminoadipic semialdehyde synthase
MAAYLPHLTVLVNGIYWEPGQPRVVGLDDLRALFLQDARPRLRVIGDISCDLHGSIEANVKITTPGDPVYVYDVVSRKPVGGVAGRGPVILAVDNLPCELPVDASQHFGGRALAVRSRARRAATGRGRSRRSTFKTRSAGRSSSTAGRLTPRFARTRGTPRMKRVLLLGAGLVSRPLAGVSCRVAGHRADRWRSRPHEGGAGSRPGGARARRGRVDGRRGLVAALVAEADLVISLLPFTLHPKAREDRHRASRTADHDVLRLDEMRALDGPARAAGVLILNEIGLDPGLDHMSAMRGDPADPGRRRPPRVVPELLRRASGSEANTNPWATSSREPAGVLARG